MKIRYRLPPMPADMRAAWLDSPATDVVLPYHLLYRAEPGECITFVYLIDPREPLDPCSSDDADDDTSPEEQN